MTQTLQVLIMVLYCVTLWFISTYRLFSIDSINYQAIALAILAQIVDIVAREIPKEGEVEDEDEK